MTGILMDFITAVLLLAGAGSAEELASDELERFRSLSEHPLRINLLPEGRLRSSGLFSAYQAAALEEYRRKYGDILSQAEFALVDGIGPLAAEALSFFVSFESAKPIGERPQSFVHQSLALSGGIKQKDAPEAFHSLKYHSEFGERCELYFSIKRPYAPLSKRPPPLSGSLSAAVYPSRGGEIILGDFAARFGMGLALWSGFSLSGFGSVAAFSRNAGGFAPTGSFSPVFSGLAGVFFKNGWTFGAGLHLPALREFLSAFAGGVRGAFAVPLLSARHYGFRGEFGIQAFIKDGGAISADGTLNLGHWTLRGEAALSSALLSEDGAEILRTRGAFCASVRWAPAYQTAVALLARYYPSGYYGLFAAAPRASSRTGDEAGIALGIQRKSFEFTADGALFPGKGGGQFKSVLNFSPQFVAGSFTLAPSLRWTERFKTGGISWRHEARLDLSASRGGFSAACRADFVYSKGFGALGYIQAGYKRSVPEKQNEFSALLRACAFGTATWENRIWCYEGDIPGSFSVPARYGRGWNIYALLGLKSARTRRLRHSLRLKASALFQNSPKRLPQTEIRLSYSISL